MKTSEITKSFRQAIAEAKALAASTQYSISYLSNGERYHLTDHGTFSAVSTQRYKMDFQTALRECENSKQHGHPAAQIITEDVWVVCYGNDFTPFRTNGEQIRLFGGQIWNTTDAVEAHRTANTLDAKARAISDQRLRVLALTAAMWAPKRINMLTDLLNQISVKKGK